VTAIELPGAAVRKRDSMECVIRTIGVVLGIVLVPGVAASQVAATDTGGVAVAMAAELREDGYTVVVEGGGIGEAVAAALGQEVMPRRPPPVCPWSGVESDGGGLLVVVRVMELTDSEARVHVDFTCRGGSVRRPGYLSLVRYELNKVEERWEVTAGRVFFET
jgi:hypothetical protein